MELHHTESSEEIVLKNYSKTVSHRNEIMLKSLEEMPLRIKRLRAKADPHSKLPHPITAKTMAAFLGEKYANMARYEAYKRKYMVYPRMQTAIKMCALFGVSLEYLITGSETSSMFMKKHEDEGKTKENADKIALMQKEINSLNKLLESKEKTIDLYEKLLENKN